jgi:Ca2+-binding EF-hand superfamily protein
MSISARWLGQSSLAMLVVVLNVSAAYAQTASTRPQPQSAPASRPAARPAASQPGSEPDLLRDAVDLYNPMAERGRFLSAAGADAAMDETEFKSAAAKADPFVRKFDRWDSMKAFDRNSDGRIDWTEADAYRQSFRKFVMESFDTNHDGKLAGAERVAANKALNNGQLFAGGPRPDARLVQIQAVTRPAFIGREDVQEPLESQVPAPAPAPAVVAAPPQVKNDAQASAGQPAAPGADNGQQRADMVKRFDKDGDGQLTGAERQAAWRDYRRGQLEQRQQAEVPQPKPELQVATQPAPAVVQPQRRFIQRFDRNGDGVLDDQEQAEADATAAHAETLHQVTERYLFRANAEGNITPEERQRGMAEMQGSFTHLRDLAQKVADTDGDGVISAQEQQAFVERMHHRQETRMTDLTKKYDADGDGKLNEQERQAMAEGIRQDVNARFASYDTNGDGHLDAEERARFIEELAKEMFGD